jgi:hypothetical protein
VIQAIRTSAATSQAVMSAVGDAPWSAALLVAVREVCGNLRSPLGLPVFAPEIRGFFGSSRAVALPGSPATVTAPAGGTISVVADWSATPPATGVMIRLTAPGVDPPVLAGRMIGQIGATTVPIASDPSGALISLTAAQAVDGKALITIANPSIAAPAAITVQVAVT